MTHADTGWQVGLPPDLEQADNARYAAMLNADTGALDRLLADDLVYTHSDGSSDSKTQYLGAIRSGALNYLGCERETVHFLPLGDQALARGCLRLLALYKEQRVSIHIHYLAAWVRLGEGAWKLVAWTSTRLPN